MSNTWASGRHALGICDMCAGEYKLRELKKEIFDQRPTGFLVCEECWDIDNPQLQLGRFPINDPQALRNPRIDTNLLQSRDMWGFDPVGNSAQVIYGQTGVIQFD